MNASPSFILPLENIVDDFSPGDAPVNPRRPTLLLWLARVVVIDMAKAGWPRDGLSAEHLLGSNSQNLPPAMFQLYRLLACANEVGDQPLIVQIVDGMLERKWDLLDHNTFSALPEAERASAVKINGLDLSGEDFFGANNALRFLSLLHRAFFRERASERLEAAFAILGVYAAEKAGFYWQRKDAALREQVRRQLSPAVCQHFDNWDMLDANAPFNRLFTFIRQQGWDTWLRYPGLTTMRRRCELAEHCGFTHLTPQGAVALVDAAVQYLQRLRKG